MRKPWSLFQNPSWKIAWSAPWWRNRHDVIFGLQYNLIISEHYLGNHASQIKSYHGTLSESHGRCFRICHEKLLIAPLAEKSRWRHIRLAMKSRYLGNHASHIKCYYGSLSGSHGRSFRIRQEKLLEEPPGGEITMTSYPACNKISLSRKPCIAHKKLIRIFIRKSRSLFQNPSWKIAWSAPWRRTDDDVISGRQ